MSDTTFIPAGRRPVRLGLGRVMAEVRLMLQRSRERRLLAELDVRILRDIGVTPYEAGVEARKGFWQR
jgi:uncharacterized protein YjiS (DUF1127 family)